MINLDISMCSGENCSLKKDCLRFVSVPSKHWQTYFLKPPYENEFHCEYFLNKKHYSRNMVRKNHEIT